MKVKRNVVSPTNPVLVLYATTDEHTSKVSQNCFEWGGGAGTYFLTRLEEEQGQDERERQQGPLAAR